MSEKSASLSFNECQPGTRACGGFRSSPDLDTGFFRVMTAGGGGSAAGQGSVTAGFVLARLKMVVSMHSTSWML